MRIWSIIGVDLDLRVNAGISSQNSAVMTGRIARGVLFLDQKDVSVREYRIDSRSDKAKVLITEHPITVGATLVSTQRPVETTDSTYRFQSTVAANAVTVLREERVWTESLSIVSTDLMVLEVFARGDAIPRAVRDAVLKVGSLKAAMSQTDRQIAEQVKQQSDIGQEQIRLRENMKTVAQNSEYYQRLLEKLNATGVADRVAPTEPRGAAAQARKPAARARGLRVGLGGGVMVP